MLYRYKLVRLFVTHAYVIYIYYVHKYVLIMKNLKTFSVGNFKILTYLLDAI